MILVFDTETSNLPQHKLPLDHPAQARIVQFACVMFDRDFKERASFCSLIKPDGWQMQPGAQSAHGITQAECQKHGMQIELVMDVYAEFCSVCDVFVAHNIKFDSELLSIEESILADMTHATPAELNGSHYCTMELMTPLCKLPGRGSGYKWPKLIEAYKHCFGDAAACAFQLEAHDALVDCRATAKVFKWLVDNKHVNIAQLLLA